MCCVNLVASASSRCKHGCKFRVFIAAPARAGGGRSLRATATLTRGRAGDGSGPGERAARVRPAAARDRAAGAAEGEPGCDVFTNALTRCRATPWTLWNKTRALFSLSPDLDAVRPSEHRRGPALGGGTCRNSV
eukprot:7380024-Prymnesium_polylepis.1